MGFVSEFLVLGLYSGRSLGMAPVAALGDSARGSTGKMLDFHSGKRWKLRFPEKR